MKAGCVLVFLALAACGPKQTTSAQEVSPHQQPTITTPGVYVTGYVNVGMKRRF